MNISIFFRKDHPYLSSKQPILFWKTLFSFFAHFLGPFELIDENGDGNITRDEWQEKIEKVMDKVMYITNVTLTDDYEDLYDDIWEALDCDNGTTQLLISRV
jgi:hypothetical protein